MVINQCETCSKQYETSKASRFCSKECYWKKGRKQEICNGCGVEFECKKSAHRAKDGYVYCSNKCLLDSRISQKTLVAFTCTQCGIEFTKAKGFFGPNSKLRFCCNACHHEWQKTNNPRGEDHPEHNSHKVNCHTCGMVIKRQAYRFRDYNHQFCSNKCYGEWRSKTLVAVDHPNWKGGDLVGYRGPNWAKQSALARKRDGYCCQHCGISQKKVGRLLDVHHIKPFRDFGYVPDENDNYLQANELSNLISLCPGCLSLSTCQTEHCPEPWLILLGASPPCAYRRSSLQRRR